MRPEDITQEDIDELHGKIMDSMKEIFDQHKDHLGWSHRKIVFE
jgi:hypothetical protein